MPGALERNMRVDNFKDLKEWNQTKGGARIASDDFKCGVGDKGL